MRMGEEHRGLGEPAAQRDAVRRLDRADARTREDGTPEAVLEHAHPPGVALGAHVRGHPGDPHRRARSAGPDELRAVDLADQPSGEDVLARQRTVGAAAQQACLNVLAHIGDYGRRLSARFDLGKGGQILTAMDPQEIDRILAGSEGTQRLEPGFWTMVAAVKRDRALVERFADRIARIDRAAFERQVPLRVPAAVGVAVDVVGVVVGIAVVATAPDRPPGREIVFLVGVAALIATTHTLAHWIVGTLVGIRFTHAFTAPPKRPQPGFKIDYASYLRAPARGRAWMHASGAIATKLVPFVSIPFALQDGLEPWAIWLLAAIGVIQLVTDAVWSVRVSDWKKFRREMRFAR